MLCEVIGEPIKRLAYLIGEPIKLTGKRARRKALEGSITLSSSGAFSMTPWHSARAGTRQKPARTANPSPAAAAACSAASADDAGACTGGV